MPTGKQKNRKNRKRGPDSRFIRKVPARIPLPEAGPSQAEPSPALPTTPNTLTAPTSPPRAPQSTRTRPRTATPPPQAAPYPAIPRPAPLEISDNIAASIGNTRYIIE